MADLVSVCDAPHPHPTNSHAYRGDDRHQQADDRPDYHTIVAHAPPGLGFGHTSWWARETKTFPDWAPQTKFARHILEANTITKIVNTMPMAASAAL